MPEPTAAIKADANKHVDTVVVTRKHIAYAGVLPPPSDLSEFEKILPGVAERLLKIAETEQAQRFAAIEMEHKERMALAEAAKVESENNSKEAKRGQFLGFLVTMACILAVMSTVLLGAPWQVCVAIAAIPSAAYITSLISTNKHKQAD